MLSFVILAQSKISAEVIQNTLKELYYPWARDVERQKVFQIIIPADSSKNKSELFTEITGEIDKFFNDSAVDLSSIYLLVDKIDFTRANVLASEGWDSLIAMLVLALPELNWRFGEIILLEKEYKTAGHRISFMHSLQSFLHPNWNPLLDGSGLRNYILSIAKENDLGKYFPIRKELAIAIDDDPTYAALHAYTAYRFGYRAYDVSTNALAEILVGKSGICTPKNDIMTSAIEANLSLTFEDVNLSFQDVGSRGYSEDGIRNQLLPGLDNTKVRRFYITTGKGNNESKSNKISVGHFEKRNRKKKNEEVEEKKKYVFYKPLAGIFGLWKECKFLNPVKWGDDFTWLPESIKTNEPKLNDQYNDKHGVEVKLLYHHSSPGAIKQIAQYLINRSIKLIEDVKTLSEAIRGAVLSMTILELLGDKEPTTISKAYELKQRFEVLAESIFGGVVLPFPLQPRFDEIKTDLDKIANWSGQEKRELVRLNNELIIISYFITIYNEKNDLGKAETCRHHTRHLQRKLWWEYKKHGIGKFYLFPINWIRWYIDTLLQSVARIVLAIVLSIVFLTFIFWIFNKPLDFQNFQSSVFYSFNSFFCGSISESLKGWQLVVAALATVGGFFHLGILIAHLYSVISRK